MRTALLLLISCCFSFSQVGPNPGGGGGGGSATPGGTSGSVQYNNAGALGGDAGFTFDPVVGSHIGPAESTLPPVLQGWTGYGRLFTTDDGSGSGQLVTGEVAGAVTFPIYIAQMPSVSGTGVSVDTILNGAGATGQGFASQPVVQPGIAAGSYESFFVRSPFLGAGSTLTDMYGLHILDLTQATNNWAIKTGLGKVEFGDRVHTTPGAAGNVGLEVQAAAAQTADLFRTLASDGTTVQPFRVLANGTVTGVAGGSSGAVQYNNAGTLGGSSLSFDATNGWSVNDTIAAPGDGSVSATVLALSGNVNNGTHCYLVTYDNGNGGSTNGGGVDPMTGSGIMVTTSTGNARVALGIPVSADPRVVARNIFRTKAGLDCSVPYFYSAVTRIADNTTTTYTDNTADGSLGAANINMFRNLTSAGFPGFDLTPGGEIVLTAPVYEYILSGIIGTDPTGSGFAVASIDPATGNVNFPVAVTSTNSPLSGTTGAVSGVLTLGTCDTGTASVPGATTGMVATTSPVSDPGSGMTWNAFVSAADTVTVRLCGLSTVTPTSTAFNVRVLQ